jgi:hypothetical protein
VLIEIVAPDEPLLYAEARRWHDPSAGIVCAILPPVASRTSEVFGAIVAAAGGVPLHRSPANEDQAVESAVARLRGHRIHTVIAMHSQWLPDRARAPLAGAAALAGIWLLLVTHEFHTDREGDYVVIDADPAGVGDYYATDDLAGGPGYESDALDPWRDAHWGWAELRDAVRARARLGGVDRAALDAPMPVVGLAGARPVAGNAASPLAAAAYDAVVAGTRQGSDAAAILRHVLKDVPQAGFEDALAGTSAGLGEAGYGIVRARVAESSRRWRDLWRTASTSAAAALVLRAYRISDRDAARLRVSDVAEDGDLVGTRRRPIPIAEGAMPFLRAQRLVAGPPDRSFLLDAGQPVGPAGVDRLVREGLAALGLEPPSGDRASDPAPSATWLLERGIAIRGADLRPDRSDERTGGPRRCRHALTGWVEVGALQVSHSQRLCRMVEAEELTPVGSRSAVTEQRDEDGIAIFVIESPWGRAIYWRVPTPLGPAWLQSRGGVVPLASAIGEGVALAHHRPAAR